MRLAEAALVLLLSQTTTSAVTKCGNVSTVDEFGSETAAKARRFVVQFQSAVAHDKRDQVASMIRYPLRVHLNGQSTLIRTKSSFLSNYTAIITPLIKSAIANQSIKCLGYASSGFTADDGSEASFVIGGDGEVWFDSKTENGPFKVITM